VYDGHELRNFEFIPRWQVPAALVFGLLDEGDITVASDGVESALKEGAVRLLPVLWDCAA